MKSGIAVLVVLIVAGCSKDSKQDSKQAPPVAAPAAGSATAPAAATTPPPATDRPASVTAEMAETFELYIAAFEKIASDLEASGTDCSAAAAAVKRDTPAIDALAARGEKLNAQMTANTDPEAGAWFGRTFGPRMQTAVGKMATLQGACETNAELRAAMEAAMAKFPMMRKKHG